VKLNNVTVEPLTTIFNPVAKFYTIPFLPLLLKYI